MKKIKKLNRQEYSVSTDKSLYGTLLFRTIKYIIFIYIYREKFENMEMQHIKTQQELIAVSHFLFLRKAYREFIIRYDKTVQEIKQKVYDDILKQTNNNKNHPTIKLFKWLVKHKELHVRQPKKHPGNNNKEKCLNSITTDVCIFDGKNRYQLLIFTKLPSDEDENLKDPKELENLNTDEKVADHQIIWNYITGEYLYAHDQIDQFEIIVTKKWGALARLLHNIFHLYGYINMYILNIIDNDRERFSKMPWMDVWVELVTLDFAKVDISEFKKAKGVPKMVVAIWEIYNIVVSTMHFKKLP